MPLNYFYITNRPEVAVIADKYGVNRIWIDLETIGKEERQKGLNTVKSNHQISDISTIRPLLTKAELLVRVNPWYEGSVQEINAVIEAGAEIIMLPMWKSVEEVRSFLNTVGGRTKTTLLLETKEAMACVDEVLKLDFDEIHIGLNDLHLSCGKTFMFELLADGTVEALCKKFRAKGIPYGFGGVAGLGKGDLSSKKVILEHYRLGSTRAILSRSFCDINQCHDLQDIEERFRKNIQLLRDYELQCETADSATFEKNRLDVIASVQQIVQAMKEHSDGRA